MALNAGNLRHRIQIQSPVETQDQDTGAITVESWVTVATVWAAIEPLSAREFITSQTEKSQVVARITIRYRNDIDPKMRIYHPGKSKFYNIEGLLSDKDSGFEYLTIPVSTGLIDYTNDAISGLLLQENGSYIMTEAGELLALDDGESSDLILTENGFALTTEDLERLMQDA